jgi:HK97 gp10 family phage protein
MAIEVKIELENADKIKKFLETRPEATKREVNNAIRKSVSAVKRQAKINAPVDTGRMRASIQSYEFHRGLRGEVYPSVRYAIHVHEGTGHMRGRPFLVKAVKLLRGKIQRFFREAMRNILKYNE